MTSGVTFSAAIGEVSLVLAILVVGNDDHLAGPEIVESSFDRSK